MRIIAGKHKGRRLELARDMSDAIRPTSDFAREAIFNILVHGKFGLNGHSFIDKDVLDVFCGTGAFGLEALSRGAARVTFIDQARDAIAIAKHNAEKMGEGEKAEFVLANATKLARARRRYALIFLDPPYFSKLIAPTLKSLHENDWIAEDALIVVEHDAKEALEIETPFQVIDQRKYGRAMVELIKLL
jgi:16S rRNA (guanine966-N2)-methyltransferase